MIAMAYVDSAPLAVVTKQTGGAASEREGEIFRLAMRELASGVALVTTGSGAHRTGCTATSLCSLSLDPPSLIVCMALTSSTLPSIRANRTFGVNILDGTHAELADRFAGRTGVKGAARFAGIDWMTLVTGAPLLRDALACIDCNVEEVLDRHTHALLIGRVAAVRRGGAAPALVHWRGRFARFD
jgi:flavin reductase (DIM6/NTAB) family NADH-FMN oxidoreductase RutF